jgi:DNA polymerase-1
MSTSRSNCGVLLDAAGLNAQSHQLGREMLELEQKAYELAGQPFNLNSPRQIQEILFDRQKLPVKKKTPSGQPSTDEDVLAELALNYPLPKLLLEYRALAKLKSTYTDKLPRMVNTQTGRVHTTYSQTTAVTGRLASNDPNLQNIPIRTELGREIRRAFIAAPGHLLISADYSQIELRVLAHMAGEDALIDAFRSGEDIHERTAQKLFGPASGLDPHDLRSKSKMVNYAVLYGKTPFTLAKDINVTQEAAQEFIDAYFAGFPRVRAFIDQTLEEARTTGIVRTLFGRRRLVPNLTSRNYQMRGQAEREAVNMPIQGTAADILKKAMIDLHAELPKRGSKARMILTVHDELLFESPRDEAEAAAAIVRERMEQATSLSVPLTVDVGIGENWNEAKP